MLDYRIHYAIMVTEDRIRDASRERVARPARGKRVVNASEPRRADRPARP